MRRFYLLLAILFVLDFLAIAQRKPANGRTNETYVWLTNNKAKLTRLFPLGKPVFENKNSFINAAVTSATNQIFEINGISPTWLKDTVIQNAAVSIVLIGKNGTWVSNKKLRTCTLQIICPSNKPGSSLNIRVQTTIYSKGKSNYRTEARLVGTVPNSQQLSTNQ